MPWGMIVAVAIDAAANTMAMDFMIAMKLVKNWQERTTVLYADAVKVGSAPVTRCVSMQGKRCCSYTTQRIQRSSTLVSSIQKIRMLTVNTTGLSIYV